MPEMSKRLFKKGELIGVFAEIVEEDGIGTLPLFWGDEVLHNGKLTVL